MIAWRMISRCFVSCCCAFLLALTLQTPASAQAAAAPPPASSSVRVYLTATNKDGSPAVLSQAELSASIDKQPAEVTSLHAANQDKLLFALLIDGSTSQNKDAQSIKSAAKQLFQSLAASGIQGYLGVFDVAVAMSRRPLQNAEAIQAIDNLKFGGGSAVFNAIGETCTGALSRSRNPEFPRRVIILLSDGDDNQSKLTPSKAEEIAAEEGVAVFSLVTPQKNPKGGSLLRDAGIKTGGQVIVARKLEEGVTPLLNAINGQWALDLVSTQPSDHKSHSLTITDSQKQIQLNAPAHIMLQ